VGDGAASTPVDLSMTGGGTISESPVEDFFNTGGFDLADGATLDFSP